MMMSDGQDKQPTKEVAGGGVVYRTTSSFSGDPRVEVLLIYRRKCWDLPKGKLEPGESIRECARREVAEEVGCSLPDIQHSLGETYHSFQRGQQTFNKTTHWYAMSIPESEQDQLLPQQEEQIEEVAWVPLTEAKERVAFQNLIDLLKRFDDWITE